MVDSEAKAKKLDCFRGTMRFPIVEIPLFWAGWLAGWLAAAGRDRSYSSRSQGRHNEIYQVDRGQKRCMSATSAGVTKGAAWSA